MIHYKLTIPRTGGGDPLRIKAIDLCGSAIPRTGGGDPKKCLRTHSERSETHNKKSPTVLAHRRGRSYDIITTSDKYIIS